MSSRPHDTHVRTPIHDRSCDVAQAVVSDDRVQPLAPLLQLWNVSKTFRGRRGERDVEALDGVSLTVGEGEIVALVGPSGSGKSTLLDLVAGLGAPDAGEIRYAGQRVEGRGHVGYLPQRDLLLPWRRVIDNATLGPEVAGRSRKRAQDRARELAPVFGLDGFETAWPSELSGGMRQRAALLRTVLIGADTLLLDEPFGALDALTRMELQDWLLTTWHAFGWTILMVTHDVDEALYLAERVYVLSERPGHIVAEVRTDLGRPRDRSMVTGVPFATGKRALLEALGVM